MGGGGWKREALGGNSERFCANKRLFVRKKTAFEDSKKWIKQAVFCLRKREAFEGKA